LTGVLIVRYSRRAEADLLEIGEYTLTTWGTAQADRYLAEIENCCERLCVNPLLGVSCDHLRPGLRRIRQGQHLIYYRSTPERILVIRILNRRMRAETHSMDEEI
jgi:toxin ParE1/3/4